MCVVTQGNEFAMLELGRESATLAVTCCASIPVRSVQAWDFFLKIECFLFTILLVHVWTKVGRHKLKNVEG